MSLRIKICGLSTPETVEAAVRAGATAVGLVFAPGSPRHIEVGLATTLLDAVPPGVQRIAVFRHPTPAQVDAIRHLPLDGLQADAEWGGAGVPRGWYFLPAYRNIPGLVARLAEVAWSADGEGLEGAFLLDGPRGGGAGVVGDPQRAARAARMGRMVLAGGLTPVNVADAIRAVRPFGVDVSSGVEVASGIKDPALIEAFVSAAREAAAQLGD
ncbi:MAG: phosphoribosylanthranilate isomerase [Deltaproteobacteria bacterium]|nr:phosphoribosylanthranilate isomerase [Deltaproteobacteria bacterium]